MELIKIIASFLGLSEDDTPEEMSGFSDEQLTQASNLASEAFEAAKEARDLAGARSATEAIEGITAALANRGSDDDFAALEARVASLSNQDGDGDAGDGNDDGTGDGSDGDDAGDAGDGDAGDDGSDDGDNGSGDGTAPPVQASIASADLAALGTTLAAALKDGVKEGMVAVATLTKPVAKKVPAPSTPPPAKTDDAPKVVITAAGDVSGFSAGQEIKPEDLAAPFVAKMSAATSGRIKDKLPVGTATVSYPEDRILSFDEPAHVTNAKIARVQEFAQERAAKKIAELLSTTDAARLTVLTAEGGLCAPVNVRYDIYGVGTDRRPLRDGLTAFQATRGGIQFNEPPVLASVDGSAAVYTEAEDASGSEYPKDCIRVECGDLITVKISAVTLCMEVGNFERITFPENFTEWWRLGKVAHARLAETTLWNSLVALATGNRGISVSTSIEGLGTTRNFLAAIARTTQQYRDRFRTGDELVLRAYIPSWVVTMMQEDLTNQAPGDSTIALAKSVIARYLAAYNVVASFVLDGQSSQKNGTYVQTDNAAVHGWPDSVLVLIAPEGALLFLDKGQLNFGTQIQDFDQIRNNDSGAFMETFENVAHIGPQLVALRINGLCNNGFTGAPNPDLDLCAQDY